MREGPVAATASSTQSSMRRPSSGWRCFGVSERMRVPRPPAMTRAARFVSLIARGAGAPGFEPGIAGPKPAALPLGYAPRIVGYRPLKSATTRFASVRRPNGKAGGPRWSASQATPQHLATPQGSSDIDLSSLPRLGSLPSGGPPAEPVSLDGRHRKRRLSTWLRPKDRRVSTSQVCHDSVRFRPAAYRQSRWASMVGIASDASALGYAPKIWERKSNVGL